MIFSVFDRRNLSTVKPRSTKSNLADRQQVRRRINTLDVTTLSPGSERTRTTSSSSFNSGRDFKGIRMEHYKSNSQNEYVELNKRGSLKIDKNLHTSQD